MDHGGKKLRFLPVKVWKSMNMKQSRPDEQSRAGGNHPLHYQRVDQAHMEV
jgi:hypothetical protein